jgi:hypothetical protein
VRNISGSGRSLEWLFVGWSNFSERAKIDVGRLFHHV